MIAFINTNWWWIGSILCCATACVVVWQLCDLFAPTETERARWEDGEIYLDPRRWDKYKKDYINSDKKEANHETGDI